MSDVIFPTGVPAGTIDSTDLIMFADVSASNATKDCTVSSLPVSTATQTALDAKVDENAAITGATKTKITYDAKGLVTAGADATTADIVASTDKNYVTDAQAVVIGNTSGTNTGDQTITLTGDVTGTGTGSFATTLANTAVTPGAYTTANITVDSKGRITAAANGSGGSGDVVGPASAIDSNFVAFDTTTGKLIKDSTKNSASFAAALGADDNYVTDAEKVVIGNTSGTNSGNQTITNSSDATSHTITLSATGGSVQLVEGANITLTTTGTGSAGVVTIASTASGSGDVVGPASATDNAIARFDNTTGKLIQNSVATIADTTGDITAGKYNTVAISGSATPTLAVTGTTTVSGANTGDQTITLTGDVTGAGTGSFATTLANTAVTPASYTSANITVDSKGRITAASNGSGGSLSWGATANGATGTGVALSMDNSYAASGIGQSITIGDTQTQALKGINISTGTSAIGHEGIHITAQNATEFVKAINIDMDGSSGKAIYIASIGARRLGEIFACDTGHVGTLVGQTYPYVTDLNCQREQTAAASVTDSYSVMRLMRSNNVSNAGGTMIANGNILYINNAETSPTGTLTDSVKCINVLQSPNSTGSVFYTALPNARVASTNPALHIVLGNTQTQVSTLSKLDTGTSAVAHVGQLINLFNASTTAYGTKYDTSTTGTGVPVYLSTGGTGRTAIKLDTGFTTSTAPTGASTYIIIDIGGTTYKLLAQAS